MSLEMGITNKVDAVNIILDSIGSLGISSIDEADEDVDAGKALEVLARFSQTIQTNKGQGFWFNRETFHAYTPDASNGVVSVPRNTLAAYVQQSNNYSRQLTLRDYKVFDTQSYGYDMTGLVEGDGKLHLTLVTMLEFDYLPTTAKAAITFHAATWFAMTMEGDMNKLSELQKYAMQAELDLKAENNSHKRHNLFNNPYIRGRIGRMGGYNNVR